MSIIMLGCGVKNTIKLLILTIDNIVELFGQRAH